MWTNIWTKSTTTKALKERPRSIDLLSLFYTNEWASSEECALHERSSFWLRIFSINLTKFPADLVTCTENFLHERLHFLCSGALWMYSKFITPRSCWKTSHQSKLCQCNSLLSEPIQRIKNAKINRNTFLKGAPKFSFMR